MPLVNKDMAFDYIIKKLHTKYDAWFSVIPINRGRHMILKPQKNLIPLFYCLYKREWIREFNNMFKDYVKNNPDMRGLAESINKECLFYSIRIGANYLLYIYPDQSIYIINPLLVKKYCEKNHLVRFQQKTNDYKLPDFQKSIERINEITYCFPIKLLERLEL